jgi:hypothetical protein
MGHQSSGRGGGRHRDLSVLAAVHVVGQITATVGAMMALQDFPTGDTEVDVAITKVLFTRYLSQNGGQTVITEQDMREALEMDFQWERVPGAVIMRRKGF